MALEQNQLDGSLESDDNVDSNGSEDELEEEQLGHCVRGCFPLLVPYEMYRCYSAGLCLIVRALGEGNEIEDIATIAEIYSQREFFDQIERHSNVIDFQPGAYVGVIMTDGDSKLFCVHRISAWTYVMENRSFEAWS